MMLTETISSAHVFGHMSAHVGKNSANHVVVGTGYRVCKYVVESRERY